MTKQEFLKSLKKELRGLSKKEKDDCLVFYSEMIDDKIEEGLTEAKAVAEIGDVKAIASERKVQAKENSDKNESVGVFDKTIIILGSPLWIPLLIIALALYITVYAVIWSLVLVLWAVEAPFFLLGYVSKGLIYVCQVVSRAVLTFTMWGSRLMQRLFKKGSKTNNE